MTQCVNFFHGEFRYFIPQWLKTSIPISELKAKGADAVVVMVQNGAENNPGAIRNAEIIALRCTANSFHEKEGPPERRGPLNLGF